MRDKGEEIKGKGKKSEKDRRGEGGRLKGRDQILSRKDDVERKRIMLKEKMMEGVGRGGYRKELRKRRRGKRKD